MKKIITLFKEKFKFELSNDSSKFLVLLLSADVLFILIHIVYLFHNPSGWHTSVWSLMVDQGVAESYQYVKEFWIVVMLAWIAIKQYRAYMLSWAALFLYVLVDDAFMLHEIWGAYLSEVLNFKSVVVHGKDFGEILFFALVGLLFLAVIGLAYFKHRKDVVLKGINKSLILCLIFLGGFGIVADISSIVVIKVIRVLMSWGLPRFLAIVFSFLPGLVEDGGEMITISITAGYLFLLSGQLKQAQLLSHKS